MNLDKIARKIVGDLTADDLYNSISKTERDVTERMSMEIVGAPKGSIYIISEDGSRLCRDMKWRGFATYGSGRSSVKSYRSLGAAKRTAREVKGKVVVIPFSTDDVKYTFEAGGDLFKTVPAEKEGYVRHEKLNIEDFVVFSAVR